MRLIIAIGAILVVLLILLILIWLLFFRGTFTLWEIFKKVFGLIFLPFQLLFNLFGIGTTTTTSVDTSAGNTSATNEMPTIASTHTEVVKHEIAECPPCNVTCPEPVPAENCKPYELEIKYLKDMVKFVGAMAKRENAINAQYRELYPGFSVMSPFVRKLSTEYNFLKNQLREDENEWTYFQNYFTKLSGIPSTSTAVHFDLMV